MSSTDNLIVITSASGKQNSHLLPLLLALPATKLRLVASSSSSASKLSQKYPTAEIAVADLLQRAQLTPVLKDATSVYHVGPGFHEHETQLGYNMIDAAVQESRRPGNRLRHFVFSSVLNTQLRKLLNHDCKRYVEEYLYESGLNWTVLQPTNFMARELFMALYEQPGREEGKAAVFQAPWNPDKRFSMVALQDLAEVGRKVLAEGEKHYMAQYPLVSTEKHTSYREAVQIWGEAMGREVHVEKKEFNDAVEGFLEMGFQGKETPQKVRDTAQRMLLYYDNCKSNAGVWRWATEADEYRIDALQGNPNVMSWLLGRKPTQLGEWAKLEMESLK